VLRRSASLAFHVLPPEDIALAKPYRKKSSLPSRQHIAELTECLDSNQRTTNVNRAQSALNIQS